MAEKLGFEKVILKNESIKGYFVSSDNEKFYNSEVFGNILNYIKSHPKQCSLKETKNRLIFIESHVNSIEKAIDVFDKISTIN